MASTPIMLKDARCKARALGLQEIRTRHAFLSSNHCMASRAKTRARHPELKPDLRLQCFKELVRLAAFSPKL